MLVFARKPKTMIRQQEYDQLILELAKVKDDLCTATNRQTQIDGLIDFLNSLCDKEHRQICGIQRIQIQNETRYLGFVVDTSIFDGVQNNHPYYLDGYISKTSTPPERVYRAELDFMYSTEALISATVIGDEFYSQLKLKFSSVMLRHFRGFGIGSAGINAIKGIAKQTRCSEIVGIRAVLGMHPVTSEAEEALYRFYEKHGFDQSAGSKKIVFPMKKYEVKHTETPSE